MCERKSITDAESRMISVRAAAVNVWLDFGTGITVAAAGLVIFYAAGWWEDRK